MGEWGGVTKQFAERFNFISSGKYPGNVNILTLPQSFSAYCILMGVGVGQIVPLQKKDGGGEKF